MEKIFQILDFGDVLVNDSIMGIGSSREQAVSALKSAGIQAISAPNFGRIFFRNCWNLGIPAIEINTNLIRESDSITLNLETGKILLGTNVINFSLPPKFMLDMINRKGLLNSIKLERDADYESSNAI
ncbi:hypothetical protein [Rothia nasisuis]|uniref:hypothetical protein n=1 Tax=Rothia nasisuis TaxID=2109647 RepID=UPI001F1AC489|nr:hypothetical protein [Rothia nasisuis]